MSRFSKLKQSVKNRIISLIARNFGVRIESNEYRGKHYTLRFDEALEWMACYSHETRIEVYSQRTGRLIASR